MVWYIIDSFLNLKVYFFKWYVIQNKKIVFIFFICFSCKNDPSDQNSDEFVEQENTLPPLEEEYDLAEVKWGFIDTSGQFVIMPQFDETQGFDLITGEIAIVVKNKKYGITLLNFTTELFIDCIRTKNHFAGLTIAGGMRS